MISVRCAKCGWAWNTKSKAWRISCPGCGIKVTVYIFPFKMENSTHKEHIKSAAPQLTQFWTNLKEGYDLFHTNQQELNYSVNSSGDYQF